MKQVDALNIKIINPEPAPVIKEEWTPPMSKTEYAVVGGAVVLLMIAILYVL